MTTLTERLSCTLRLHKALKAKEPQTIFLHSSFAGFLGRISSFGLPKKTKIFYIPHCISFMRQDISPIKKKIFILLEWIAALKKADYIACSISEQKEIQRSIPFRDCHLVENALDFSSIPTPKPEKPCKTKKTVITVGQIRPQKGPSIFSNIARTVKKTDQSVEFVWVGDGDPLARTELEEAGVKVIGWVPKDQVFNYLGNADLYLSTALWEGMPVSLIEASCAGLPVVASNCAGNIDVIEHQKTGWIFQTPDEACSQIFYSFKNPETSQSIAKNALDIAKKRFSVDRYYREMEALTKS